MVRGTGGPGRGSFAPQLRPFNDGRAAPKSCRLSSQGAGNCSQNTVALEAAEAADRMPENMDKFLKAAMLRPGN